MQPGRIHLGDRLALLSVATGDLKLGCSSGVDGVHGADANEDWRS